MEQCHHPDKKIPSRFFKQPRPMIAFIRSQKGLFIAVAVLTAWASLLVWLLRADMSTLGFAAVPLALAMMFLYTGLFITAHDAMHGGVSPHNPKLNDFIGWLSTINFALLSFRNLKFQHGYHHEYPVTDKDPDSHDGTHKGFFRWYMHFALHYITWPQLLGMAIVFNVLHYGLGIGQLNLILFWEVPCILSTVQLFYFGTYLPHREPEGGYTNSHRSSSNDYSTLMSFITCYHFGYHLEHHVYPAVPWWRLPAVRHRGKA
jgi:beta-carotene ketolase (CrtW type)